jgi:hypothetical protein
MDALADGDRDTGSDFYRCYREALAKERPVSDGHSAVSGRAGGSLYHSRRKPISQLEKEDAIACDAKCKKGNNGAECEDDALKIEML